MHYCVRYLIGGRWVRVSLLRSRHRRVEVLPSDGFLRGDLLQGSTQGRPFRVIK